jgi:NitT/TauT family transport system substrate-binding protein
MLGTYDPFALALQRGYYRDSGIDLTINEGNSSLVAAQTIVSGKSEFAYADAGTGATLISKGAKMKFVGVFQRKGALIIIHHASLKIKSLADIKGRTVIHGANDSPTQMFGAVLAKNNMTWNDVNSTIIAPGTYAQAFLQDKEAVLLGNSFSTFQSIKVREPTAGEEFFSDLGVNLMGSAIIASDQMLKENPELVRKFLAATVRGFEDAVKDPDAAVEAAAAVFPVAVGLKKAINRAELLSALDLLNAPGTEGKPLGWTSPGQWENLVSLLKEYGGMSDALPAAAYYTNEYLAKD